VDAEASVRIEVRERWTNVNGLRLKHHDLLFVPEIEDESRLLDLLGDPGSYVQGQIRLSDDGYGEHYMLIQPRLTLMKGTHGYSREFPEYDELLALSEHRLVIVPNPQRAETPVQPETQNTPKSEV
jgi:hypothetical protein